MVHYNNLSENLRGRSLFARLGGRCKDNIKFQLKETGCDSVD
jgi:hypothetical protein